MQQTRRAVEAIRSIDPTIVVEGEIGNMHGLLTSMVRGEAQKRLDVQRIKAIKEEARVPITLHGGSGTNDGDLRQAIKAGITIVHINTELRLACRRGVEAYLVAHPDEVTPYKILSDAVEAVRQVVTGRRRLFSS